MMGLPWQRGRRKAIGGLVLGLACLGPIDASASPEDDVAARGRDPVDVLAWSASLMAQVRGIHSSQDENGLGGFFDQYQFTPNKGAGATLELGLRDARVDWIVDRAPLLQLRFESPAANLGVTGSDIDHPFLSQRAFVLGRASGLEIDATYHRFRTEALRIYPETDAGGGALPFTDFTSRDDRFKRERTGLSAEVRWRPDQTVLSGTPRRFRFAPELSFRGGFERRESRRQIRSLLQPGNDWFALGDEQGDDVSDVGAGLLIVPAPGLTLTVDFDYQRFEADDAISDDVLPFTSVSRSVAFVPSTARQTGRIGLHARLGDSATVRASFQATRVEQEGPETPAQRGVDFDENETIALVALLSGDVSLTRRLSTGVILKIAHREHDLDRTTALFNPTDGSQVDAFLDEYDRIEATSELRYRASRAARFAAGVKLLWIERDLDLPRVGRGNTVVQPENTLVSDRTQMWTLFGRANLRPMRSVAIRAELSYRAAPDTGYVTDLDDLVEGELRATWTLPTRRPATLGASFRGGVGQNDDFRLVEGLAPSPPGPTERREYDRSYWTLGLTGDWIWRDDTTLFASAFYSRDRQGDDLLLSDVQRYFQEAIPLGFRGAGKLDFQSDELALVLGARHRLDDATDVGLSYGFTRAETDYVSAIGPRIRLIDANRIVQASIHSLDLELRHTIRPGLRLFTGYRLQVFSDGAPRPTSTGSVRRPPDRSDLRHTATFGVTLDGDLFAKR